MNGEHVTDDPGGDHEVPPPPTSPPVTAPVVLATPAAALAWSEDQRRLGRTVAMVPTMGALHDGHRALIRAAHRHADLVVVSIFVNPMQFDRADDFDRYPRPIDDDLVTCAAEGVAAVYAPLASAMYPTGFDTTVEPGAVAAGFEGAGRPGHFTGVTTVVAKLFAAVRPHVAVFGQKDAQQLAIVRRLAADLDLGVEIVALPTVRESDGLARSSRNVRLSSEQRHAAVCVPEALALAADAVAAGERSAAAVARTVNERIDAEPLARVEYVGVVDAGTFAAVDTVPAGGALVVLAVWFGEVRLIDNRIVGDGLDHHGLDHHGLDRGTPSG